MSILLIFKCKYSKKVFVDKLEFIVYMLLLIHNNIIIIIEKILSFKVFIVRYIFLNFYECYLYHLTHSFEVILFILELKNICILT